VNDVSEYDAIARLYDEWSRSVVEDVPFYVEEARASGGPVVELAVGTGRIAVPIAASGIPVIGVDSSHAMLEICAERAALAGAQLDLRFGDLRDPPVSERVPLVICPFRAYLHMRTDAQRRRALAAARKLLRDGGRLVFDVFKPGDEDIAATDGRWIEYEPGIWERADWDTTRHLLKLSVRRADAQTTMTLAWVEPAVWEALLVETGFEVEATYGWFDRRPYTDGEDTIFVARRSG
jgi:SAM-dependent methyltransferase